MPRLSVRSRITRATSTVVAVEQSRRRPARARARSLSSLPDTTHTRAPICLQICSAASATPPPMPQINTSSPGCTRARVTIMRHAVSVASVNAAAFSGGIVVGIVRTFAAGTTTYSAIVPGRCSPRMPKRGQSGCSPSRQYSHVRSLMPGLMTT